MNTSPRLALILSLLLVAVLAPASVGAQSAGTDAREDEDPRVVQLRGLSSFKEYPNSIQIARMLLAFKNSDMGQDAALRFYQDLAGNGLTMFDVIQAKTHINNAGMGEHFLGETFKEAGSPVEMALLTYRRQLTVDGIRHVVEQFKGRGGNNAIYLAEIGKWAKQADRALTFAGDIDFSFVSNDTQLSWAMKQAFDAYIEQRTKLTSTAFDSVCTAHGRATPDVYIGDHGKMYGDDAMKDGGLKLIDLVAGSIAGESQPGKDIILHMVLEQHAARHQGGLPELKAHLEPGLSMEMVRHFNHDIVAPKLFDPIDSILKASKYLDRSNTALKDIPGAKPSPPELAEFTREITKAAQTSDWSKIAQLLKTHFRDATRNDALEFEVRTEGGRPVAELKANEKTVEAFFARCNDAMWKNVQAGFEFKLKDLDAKILAADNKKLTMQELNNLRGEMKQLVEMLKIELLAAEQSHLKVPDAVVKLNETLNAKVDAFLKKHGARSLTDAEMKELEFIKELVKAKTPAMHAKAIAFIVDRASKAIDKTNNILDWVDDTLLGDLRGQNPEFDDFVDTTKKSRIEGKLDSAKLAVVNTKAYKAVQQANMTLNDILNKTAARRGAMKVMMGFNLAQEIPAYFEAWNREGYVGLASELFRRRVPGGGVIDAYYQENYFRMGVEFTYVVFPPLAIPEGLYGMASQSAGWASGKLDSWRYDDMVNELFKGAQFEKVGKNYEISSIAYRCYTYTDVTLKTREDILGLPKKCPRVYETILPQIQDHPMIRNLQDILKQPSVSSGRSGAFPYTYDTSGSRYGKQLYDLYLKKVDEVVLEYFKGVVERLEAAKKWASGTGYADIIRIERELGCTKPLVSFTVGALGSDDILGDAQRFQKIVADYNSLKEANKAVLELKNRWQFDRPEEETRSLPPGKDGNPATMAWGKDYLPECEPASIAEKSALAKADAGAFKSALAAAASDVEKIVGGDYCRKAEHPDLCVSQTYGPASRAALCKAYYSGRNRFIHKDCEDQYAAALKDLEKLRSGIRIEEIVGPDKACVGRPMDLQVRLDRDCPDCQVAWSVPDYRTEEIVPRDQTNAGWTPKLAGRTVVRVSVRETADSDKALTKDRTVEVQPEDKCPSLRLVIRADINEIEENEVLTLTTEPEAKGGGEPISAYVWSEDGVVNTGARASTYAFSGVGKRGKEIKVGVRGRMAFGWTETATITIKVKKDLTNELGVAILPADKNALVPGEKATFATQIRRRADSGLMRHQWTVKVNDRLVEPIENNRADTFTLPELSLKEKDKVTLAVYVQDTENDPKSKRFGQMIREGQAERTLVVHPGGSLEVALGDVPASITDSEELKVCVEKPVPGAFEAQNLYQYSWQTWVDNGWRVNQHGRCGSVPGQGKAGQTLKLRVKVSDAYGRTAERETPGVKVVETPAYHLGIVRTSQEPPVVGTPVSLQAKPSDSLRAVGGLRVQWLQDGAPLSEGEDLDFRADQPGEYRLQAVATARQGGQDKTLAQAAHVVTVREKETDKKDDPDGKDDAKPGAKVKRGAGGSVSGMFPGEPFNGMQISYSASGCSFPNMKDHPGFGTYRRYEGRLGNGTMTVSGTARMGAGFGADLVVSVTAGGKTAEHKAYIKSGSPGFNSESFNLSVPIPDDATTGGFSIVMDGHYSMGGGWRGLGVTGTCFADGPEGEAPKGTEDLSVDLNDQKDPVPVGHKVELTAHTKGGRFPYEYAWTGVDGKDDKASFTSKKPGDFTVTVKVSDTDGGSASDTTQIKVAPLKFELVGVPTKPIYGSSAKLTARAVGPAPQGAKLRYLWQSSEKGVELSPTESENGETTVTFGRLSSVKLWAQVVDADTGTAMGETPQVATTVVAPAFSVRFTPPGGQGRIGQEVKAQIVANPEVPAKLIDYRWLEPATSNRREATENASEIGFAPKDAKPVVLKALARVPFHGDELGTIEASYTGAPYKVQVSVEERGPKPMTWDPAKGGLVPVPKGTYAADEQVGLRATLEGEPKPAEVRWRWTVNDGTTIGNPISQTPTVSRHESGAITATVEALDRDGNVLGSGTTSLSVTVSADAVGNAKAKAEAAKLVAQAKAAWARKDPGEALALIEKAQKLDPKDAEIGRLVNEYRDGKARFDRAAALREEGGRLQGEKKLAEALDRYKQAQALWPDPKLAEHIAKVEAALAKEREVEAKTKALREEAARLAQAGKLDEAIAKVEESIRVRATPEAEQQLRDLKAARDRKKAEEAQKKAEEAQKQAQAKALRDEGAALQAKGDLTGALAKFKAAQQLLPDPRLADHIAKIEAALKDRQALIDQAEALRRNPQSIGCGKGLGDATALADRLQKVDADKAAVLRKDVATVAMAAASSLVANQLDFAKGTACLEVAQKLDPANAQIGQELERARQIQANWRELQALPPRMDAAAAAGRILEADQLRSRAMELAKGIEQVPPVRDLLASLVAKWDRAMAVYRAHRDSLTAELQAMLDGRRYQELIARGEAELTREWYPGDAQRIREFQSHAREKMAYEASQKAPPQSPAAPAATPGGTAPTATTGQGTVPGKATGAGTSAGGGCGGLQRTDVTRRTWRFGRSNNTVVAESVRLTEAGRMEGYYHPNEHAWSLENGVLVFRNPGNEAITRFTQCTTQDGRLVLRGPYALDKSFEHILTEIGIDPAAAPSGGRTPDPAGGGPSTGTGVPTGIPTSVPPGSATPSTASGGGSQGGTGSIDIEACVDGSDWLRIEGGRLVHEHRAFAQIGAHPGCPASHAVAGGGLLVNGQSVPLTQLPYPVGIASLGRFELTQGRGGATMDGAKGLLIDDDALGGPSVYVVRLFGGATSAGPAATPPKPPVPKQVRTGNVGAVTNGPTAPTTFTFDGPVRLVWLQTYHWNGARGATPGRIGLRHQDGTVFGPWPTRGLPGQGGVPNAYWRAEPGVVLKPGTYTVTDSDPATWATNAEAGNKGFADLEVVPVTDAAVAPSPDSIGAPAATAAAPATAPAATPPASAAPAAATVLTGRWEASCDGNDDVYPVTMRQDGNRLRIVVEGQAEYQGTFDGHRLKGTSADGLDGFDGTAVSASELRLDWEGRTSADSSHVYHNSCTLRRKGPPPAEAATPPKPAAPAAPGPRTPPATSTKAPAPAPATATAPKGGAVPCKRGGSNPFEEDICIEVDKMVPVAPR